MTAAISIENLSKTYQRSWRKKSVAALDNMSLEVAEGEAFGFIGPNGAGKSTTIKILTGAMRQSLGIARLFGVSVDQAESRRGMGYVPENPSLPDYLTPLEILQMAMRLHGHQTGDARAHCMAWLERLQLSHVADKPIRSFSKGMAQRTALAHALAVKPRLLVLDEPLSGLDPIGRRDVIDILAEYKKNGGTLFFTSHVLHDVERLADRFGLIHQGRLRAVRSPSELLGEEDMAQVRSHGDQMVAGMVQESSGIWSAQLPRAELWPLMQRLQQAGHVLIEVKPALSLESAFLKIVRKSSD